MTNGGPTPSIVIEGTFEFSPGDARTFARLHAERDGVNDFWFCAELNPDRKQVRFRIATEDIERMSKEEDTPATRGERLVERLIAWLSESPDNRLSENVNDFQVSVSEAGDTLIERLL